MKTELRMRKRGEKQFTNKTLLVDAFKVKHFTMTSAMAKCDFHNNATTERNGNTHNTHKFIYIFECE